MSSINGGQVWRQGAFPYFTCYLVYLGGLNPRAPISLDGWVRIHPPDMMGNIAWAGESGHGPIYTTAEMEALLERHNYTLVGNYAELQKAEREETWEMGRAYERKLADESPS